MAADRHRKITTGTRAAVLSAQHLIRNKRAVGRTQDLADVEWLEKAGKK